MYIFSLEKKDLVGLHKYFRIARIIPKLHYEWNITIYLAFTEYLIKNIEFL